jgi:F420H(2)-dependent quinone reductase
MERLEVAMAEYVPSPREWVANQVALYEGSGGTEGLTLRETGLPVVIVTNVGNKTGAVRKTPLMRVADGANYVLVASRGGAPTHPVWTYNLRESPDVEVRDETQVFKMRVRELEEGAERDRLWEIAVAAYPPYADYQVKAGRLIPVFLAEPVA